MALWVSLPFRSPRLCNLSENLQQLGECRAAFGLLEKGNKDGQLSLKFTQMAALELADRPLDLGFFSTSGRERNLGGCTGHDW